ncbi:HAD family hydrolase [Dethiosulfatarculus sandiegensis]|uniref:Haloacid dehalogenase n=1 Tax=Dethiosulfatarculus sandiegensis TaxID=1429043 RepID=A0A0D2J7Y9_9BACT|nr:HAD family hydrolase [Dethiosulfatarculus sandiegensis]KIX14309.1 haloacid dehalogenase [Dethiosulfatarculus sandiegensis]
MKNKKYLRFWAALVLVLVWSAAGFAAGQDPLPSWRDGAVKKSVIGFVEKVTRQGGPEYMPPLKRIAVFDNDGTLWAEKPLYFPLFFALDRLNETAPNHPEWKNNPTVQAALSGDSSRLAKLGEKGILELIGLTRAGMTSREMREKVRAWPETTRHPQKRLRFVDMVYQPMLELLAFLRANGFKTYIVSGGGVDFIRAFSKKVYGIPCEQVIGSSLKNKWRNKDGAAEVVKLPQLNIINDKQIKTLNIDLVIGQRPLMAVGNSDGDLAMLQWTAAGAGPRYMMLLHHDDAQREFAYDRKSHVGRLDLALDQARQRGWTLVSMQRDFARIFEADKD